MKFYNAIAPYSLLDSNDWSVATLYYHTINQTHNGIAIGDIAKINKVKFSSILKTGSQKEYHYIDVGTINVETGTVSSSERTKVEDMPSRAKTVAHQGDVLMSLVRPERGAVAIVPAEMDGCIVSNAIAVLTPTDTVSSALLYFLLRNKTVRQELSYQAKNSTVPTITIKQLAKYLLPNVAIPHPKKVLAERVYEDWLAVVTTSKSMKTIADEVFTRYLLVNGQNEIKKINYVIIPHTKLHRRWDVDYYLTLLKPCAEWNVRCKRLEGVAEFQPVIPDSSVVDGSGSIRRLKLKNLVENELYLQPEEIESEEYVNDSPSKESITFLEQGDVVIPRIGGIAAKAMIVPASLRGIDVMKQIIVIRPNRENIIPEYLALYFKTSWGDEQVKACTVGIGQAFIQQASLRRILVPIPSLELQMKIVKEITQRNQGSYFTEQKEAVNKFIDELISQKATTE